MRVAFLFNHAVPHQVPHAAPFAFVLSRDCPQIEVVIACSTPEELALAREIAALYPGHRCRLEMLALPRYLERLDPLISLWSFHRKQAVLRHNLEFFRGLDALVSPEVHCVQLRRQPGLANLRLIRVRHGAGDREGVFDERLRAFDFMLLPGQKYVDRLRGLGLLPEGGHALAGYPKFEVIEGFNRPVPRLWENDRPVVRYNTPFDAARSAWQTMGLQVLDSFAAHPEYNLIFAPHLVLFKRRLRHRAFLPRRYRRVPNIHVDLGSNASVDMSYLRAADIYLGDVSSQVYEFLQQPRPCVFLNAHAVDWTDNRAYAHWHLGQVVDRVEPDLHLALQQAGAAQERYRARQEQAFAYTFYHEPGVSAAELGARAIAAFLARTGAVTGREEGLATGSEDRPR